MATRSYRNTSWRQPLLAAASTLVLSACASGGAPAPSAEMPEFDRARVALSLAESAERSGNWAAAARFYGQAIIQGEKSVVPWIKRGDLLLKAGSAEAAAENYRSAFDRGYSDPRLNLGYGKALAQLNKPRAALQQLDLAKASLSNRVDLLNARGIVLDNLGHHYDAQEEYLRALSMAPGNLTVQNNLAMSYGLSGEVEEGIRILEDVFASGRSEQRHRQNLALLYGLAGHMEDAEDMARRDLTRRQVDRNLAFYATAKSLVSQSGGSDVSRAIQMARAERLRAQPAPEVEPEAPSNPAPAYAPPAEASEPAPEIAASEPERETQAMAPAETPVPEPVETATGNVQTTDTVTEPEIADTEPAPAEPAPAMEAQPAQAPVAKSLAKAMPDAVDNGEWGLALGTFEDRSDAQVNWARLRIRQQAMLDGLTHSLGEDEQGVTLYALSYTDESGAEQACGLLSVEGLECKPVRLDIQKRPAKAAIADAPAPADEKTNDMFADADARQDKDSDPVETEMTATEAVDPSASEDPVVAEAPAEPEDQPEPFEAASDIPAPAHQSGSLGEAWVLDLGSYASQTEAGLTWVRLRTRFNESLGGLPRFRSTEIGATDLVAGPVSNSSEAQDLCSELVTAGIDCQALPRSAMKTRTSIGEANIDQSAAAPEQDADAVREQADAKPNPSENATAGATEDPRFATLVPMMDQDLGEEEEPADRAASSSAPAAADAALSKSATDSDKAQKTSGRDLESGWGVNLGAYEDARAARLTWARMRARHGYVLSDLEYRIDSSGPQVKLVAGPLAGMDGAQDVCVNLQFSGDPCSPERF